MFVNDGIKGDLKPLNPDNLNWKDPREISFSSTGGNELLLFGGKLGSDQWSSAIWWDHVPIQFFLALSNEARVKECKNYWWSKDLKVDFIVICFRGKSHFYLNVFLFIHFYLFLRNYNGKFWRKIGDMPLPLIEFGITEIKGFTCPY